MNRKLGILLATGAVGMTLALGGCAESKTTIRSETEIRSQPRVEERTTVVPPDDETTVIERRRHTTVEEDQ